VFGEEILMLGKKRKTIDLLAPVLAITALLAAAFPSLAVTASYGNEYRVCTARLLSVNVGAEAAAQACSTALYPKDLSACAIKIQKQTQIPGVDALSSCRQARLPKDLATCVVGISANSKETFNPAVLTYCNRSLLPLSFARCVVGLRAEVDLVAAQAMDTCIDGSDRLGGLLPPSAPPNQRSMQFNPTFETTPIPGR
jgi:hypothetical protein